MPLVTKVLTTSVDLYKPSEIYTSDVIGLLKNKLLDRYVGKCYQSILIMSITKIIKHSDTHLVDNRLDGSAYIDVQFEVEGLVLVGGEILHGCRVIDITVAGIIIEHTHASGLVHIDIKRPISKIIKKDQLIPVVIQSTRYNPSQTQITIRGFLYEPVAESNIYYNITDIVSAEDTEKLSSLLADLDAEVQLHSEIGNTKNYEFFRNMMYPYKNTQKFELSEYGKKFKPVTATLKNLLEIRDGSLVSAIESYKNNGIPIYHREDAIANTDARYGNVIQSNLYPALEFIIGKRLMYLRNLRGFTKQYDTPAKIQEMMIYWQVCQSSKV